MSLVSFKEMLADASKRHYAVPMFDVSNATMMRSAVETAEEAGSPIILAAIPFDIADDASLGWWYNSAVYAAQVKVPVCLHLDHATDFTMIEKAINAGFSSVMYDGSVLDFDNNAKNTAQVVKLAHAHGITVEAELGHVGNGSVGSISETGTDTDPGESLTVPEEVARFVEITDVDALAVAIGTAHGVYQKTPTLRIDRLDEIAAVCERPLVLHGGSGTPNDQMQNAIQHGITKINIYSDVVGAMNKGLKDKLNAMENPATWPFLVFADARAMMKEVARNKLRTFGSAGRL